MLPQLGALLVSSPCSSIGIAQSRIPPVLLDGSRMARLTDAGLELPLQLLLHVKLYIHVMHHGFMIDHNYRRTCTVQYWQHSS